jgi:acetyl-CoA carboxylase carboxyl transferase subunit beta
VLVGEGGSGGALAALCCDRLLMTEDSYFAALVPEGAGAALRRSPEAAAALLRPTPRDLLASGVADGLVPSTRDPGFTAAVAAAFADLAGRADAVERQRSRVQRWRKPASAG